MFMNVYELISMNSIITILKIIIIIIHTFEKQSIMLKPQIYEYANDFRLHMMWVYAKEDRREEEEGKMNSIY